jgi:RNA polymerase sigma-70 factor (ECF subfamily)
MKHITTINQEGEDIILEYSAAARDYKPCCETSNSPCEQELRDPSRRSNGPNSSSEEGAIDARVAKTFAGVEKKSMQTGNTYGGTDKREEVGGEQGAAQQLEQILVSGLPPLYRRAYRILGNTADAEDAVQDALLAAYTHLNQFRGQAQISTWLTTIVLNCARMQLRRRPRRVHVSLDESRGELQPLSVSERLADHRPNPEDESIGSELSSRLSHLHRQLSPTLRRTLQLRDVQGLSVRETARILGVPTGTVKAQSARARKRLKELMRGTLGPQPRRPPHEETTVRAQIKVRQYQGDLDASHEDCPTIFNNVENVPC